MQLTPFVPTDLDALPMAEPIPPGVRALLVDQAAAGLAMTARGADGIPLLCGGVLPSADGVGDAWVVVAPAARAYPVGLTRAIRAVADEAIRRFGLRVLQATILADDHRAARFAERLGFTWEGRAACPCGRLDIVAWTAEGAA